MYYRYVAHLRTLAPGDSLLVLAEGMAVFACISRQVPEALAVEREKLLTEFTQLCRKHETTTVNTTTDTRAMFAAHQKLFEQSIGTWQSREQQAVQALERVTKAFEKDIEQRATRLHALIQSLETAIQAHKVSALETQRWVKGINWDQRIWPCIASLAVGILIGAAVLCFGRH